MMMSSSSAAVCKTTCDAASDYLEEKLGEPLRLAVEEHVASCLACKVFLGELKMTMRLLARLHEDDSTQDAERQATLSYGEYYPEPEMPSSLEDWTLVKLAWGELARLSRRDRARLIRQRAKYQDPHLCDWLLVRARRVCSAEPDRAFPLADAALEIARQRHRKFKDAERLVEALDVMAWCLVVLRRFVKAAEVLDELGAFCEAVVVPLEGRARYLATKGMYLSGLGQFKEGERFLEEALKLWRGIGSRKNIICQLVNLAGTVLSAGEAKRGLVIYREAEALLNETKDPPRLQLAVYSNLMLALCEADQPAEARGVLAKVKELARSVGGWYSGLYAVWLEGTLLRVEGRHARAQYVFEGVRSEFLERRHAVWFVEASLDLAHVYMKQGELAKLDVLARDLVRRVDEIDGDEAVREAVASFRQAVRHCSLTRHVLSSIAVALRAARLGQRG